MLKRPVNKKSTSFMVGITCLLLLVGLLVGGLLKGNALPGASGDILMGEQCYRYLRTHENLESAVSQAVIGQEKSYARGEFSAEGHIILGIMEDERYITVYTMASFGAFGFENGIFTKVSGSGAIPTVIYFTLDEKDGYYLTDYREPLDGEGYLKSVKELFPEILWDRVLKENHNNQDLYEQQKRQSETYLRTIGRKAEVATDHVKKELSTISTAASNKIFSEFMKFDQELNKFPYWIGSREAIENGIRYIFRTTQDKSDDGYDRITFTKSLEDGTIVSETAYQIIGDEPVKMDSE